VHDLLTSWDTSDSSSVSASSAFVDLYLAIYPATVLMKLHMSLRKRIALCAALGLGAMYVARIKE
jgi:hypothetical protein